MNPVQDIINSAIASDPNAIANLAPDAPGGMSVAPGGAATGYVNIPGLSIPAPSPTAVIEPTLGQSLGTSGSSSSYYQSAIPGSTSVPTTVTPTSFNAPSAYSYGDPKIEAILRGQATSNVDPRKIRREIERMFRAEIDATNDIYDQLLEEARIQGEGRLGSQRAGAARGGILGSDFAGSQKKKVQDYNTAIAKSINAERQAKISSIMGFARESASNEIARQTLAQQQGAQSYLAYLGEAEKNKTNNINAVASALLTQGVDPSQIPDELEQIAGDLGTTTENILATYKNIQASSQANPGDQFTLSAGQARYDAAGNLIAEGPAKSDNGTIYSTSKGLVRIGANGEPELVFSTGGGGTSSTGVSFTNSEKKKLEQAGLSSASRQEQLDYLYGEDTVSGQDLEVVRGWLAENRDVSPEVLKQELLSQGYTVTMANSLINTRPLSYSESTRFAEGLLTTLIDPALFQSRSGELEDAKAAAKLQLEEMLQSGQTITLKSGGSVLRQDYQLTPDDVAALNSYIDSLSGSDTASRLIKNK